MPVAIAEKLNPGSPGIDSLHPRASRSDRSATRGDFRRRFGPPVYGLLRKGKCGVEAVPLAASHRARTRQSRRSGRGAGDPEGARRRAWLFAPANDPAGSRYHLSARGQAAHQPRPAEANFRAPSLPGTSRGINFQRVRSPLESSRELQGQAIVRSGRFASDSTRDRHAGSSKLSQRESAWKSLRDFSLRLISWLAAFWSRRQDVEGVGCPVERKLPGCTMPPPRRWRDDASSGQVGDDPLSPSAPWAQQRTFSSSARRTEKRCCTGDFFIPTPNKSFTFSPSL